MGYDGVYNIFFLILSETRFRKEVLTNMEAASIDLKRKNVHVWNTNEKKITSFYLKNVFSRAMKENFISHRNIIYSKIPILRPPLGLSKSGLKDHFWTVPKVVSNKRYTVCRK